MQIWNQHYRKRPPPRSTLGTPLGAGSLRKRASGFWKLGQGCKNVLPPNQEALHPGASFRNLEVRFQILEARFLNASAKLPKKFFQTISL
jgi:hypothetical protein